MAPPRRFGRRRTSIVGGGINIGPPPGAGPGGGINLGPAPGVITRPPTRRFTPRREEEDDSGGFAGLLRRIGIGGPAPSARELNLSEEELDVLDPVVRESVLRGRSPNPLGTAFRAFRAIGENPMAGFATGVEETMKKYGGSQSGIDVLRAIRSEKKNVHFMPPWAYVEAVGKGFSEIPGAIREDKTFEGMLKEQANPNSFWYRHSAPVGLTMSIFWDPTTYLTFGASTSSKIAARNAWAFAIENSSKEGRKMMARGAVNPRTGKAYKPGEEFEAVHDAHVAMNLPFTQGDVLKRLQQEAETIPGYRGPFRGSRAKGGVKLAGSQIPGTPQLAEAMGRQGRRLGAHLFETSKAYRGIVENIIPDAAARHITNDLVRTRALVDVQRMRDTARVGEYLREDLPRRLLQQKDTATGRPLHEVLTPDQLAEMKTKPVDQLDDAQRTLLQSIKTLEGSVKRQARKPGPGGKTGMSARRLELKQQEFHAEYADPLAATAAFTSWVQTRMAYRALRQRVINDPVFSYELKGLGERKAPLQGAAGMEDFARHNYDVYTHGNKRYAVYAPVKQALDKLDNGAYFDHQVRRFLEIANWAPNKWKVYATQPNPSFHTMNLVGAMWNNNLAIPYNNVDYVQTFGELMRSRIEVAAKEGRRFLGRKAVSTPETAESRALVESGTRRGGLGRSSQVMAETEGLTGAAAAGLQYSGKERFFKEAEFAKSRIGVVPRTLIRRGRQAAAVGATAVAGPLAGAILAAPEAAKVGRALGGTIEDLVRLAPYRAIANDQALKQTLEAFAPPVPPGLKHPGWTKRQQDVMYDSAAAVTRHFQFDYTHLTDFERDWAKTFFPFYTFYARNMGLQAVQLAKQPGKYAVTSDMMDFIDNLGVEEGPMKSLLPLYYDQLSAFQVPVPNSIRDKLGLPMDMPIYLNPKLPFATLNMMPQLWIPLLDDSPRPFYQKVNAAFAPTWGMVGPTQLLGAKTWLEVVTGTQLGLAKPIDYQRASSNDFRQSMVAAPGFVKWLPKPVQNWMGVFKSPVTGEYKMPATHEYVLQSAATPYISNLGAAIPAGGKDPVAKGKVMADRVSWVTGMRLMPFDGHLAARAQAYAFKNEMEAKKSELREKGLELSDEDAFFLDEIEELIDVIQEVEKTRNEELYGESP